MFGPDRPPPDFAAYDIPGLVVLISAAMDFLTEPLDGDGEEEFLISDTGEVLFLLLLFSCFFCCKIVDVGGSEMRPFPPFLTISEVVLMVSGGIFLSSDSIF